uniref:Uncharacterized protein n=1 Tax=Rhizophora mucronata TaxID=61149 RepID=A0A2P2NIU9_RHIMU
MLLADLTSLVLPNAHLQSLSLLISDFCFLSQGT